MKVENRQSVHSLRVHLLSLFPKKGLPKITHSPFKTKIRTGEVEQMTCSTLTVYLMNEKDDNHLINLKLK